MSPQKDWFSENSPTQAAPASGDWFADQAPTKTLSATEQFFADHPNLKQLALGTANALPGIGAMVGGVAGGATGAADFGTTAIPAGLGGMALGAAAGRNLRDVAVEQLGLEPKTDLTQKFMNTASEAATTGATGLVLPGVVEAASSPVRTFFDIADSIPNALRSPGFNKTIDLLRAAHKFGPSGAPAVSTLARPAWQATAAAAPAEKIALTAEDVLRVKSLMAKGAAQDKAVELVLALKSSPVFKGLLKR